LGQEARTKKGLATLGMHEQKKMTGLSARLAGPDFRDEMLADGLDADYVARGVQDREIFPRFGRRLDCGRLRPRRS